MPTVVMEKIISLSLKQQQFQLSMNNYLIVIVDYLRNLHHHMKLGIIPESIKKTAEK